MNRDDSTRLQFSGDSAAPPLETLHSGSALLWDRIIDLTEELAALPADEAERRLAVLLAAGEPEQIIARVRIHLGIQQAPKTSEELKADTIVGGEYRIVSKLGSGGMGVVYEAVLEKTGQTVALKMIQPGLIMEDMRDRFIREMKALGRLDHPNIAGIRHAGRHTFEPDGVVSEFFTMDQIIGSRVQDYLQTPEASSLSERLRIIRDAAIAVQYAHDREVIHRDLKPGNMMIRTDGRVMIFDFGLAAALALNENSAAPLGAEGTPPYMAPEQADAAPASPAADIYSLGAILYEMLTGEPLFRLDPRASRMVKVQAARHPPPRPPLQLSDAPHALSDILDKALALAPEDRFPSAAAFARAINRLLPAHLVNDPPHRWHPAAGAVIPATDWVLEEKLGDGAHGQVWLARNRPVVSAGHEEPLIPPPRVYKFCATEEAARSLRREHRVFQALKAAAASARFGKAPRRSDTPPEDGAAGSHEETPGILPVEAWSLDDPPYYIAMRWMEGACDLATWAESRPVSEEQAVAIACSVADALQFAHDIGVLHRDVKPANILVRDDPAAPGGVRAWLVDFGLAAFDETLWQSFLTRSISSQADFDKLAGTPDYIAPEIRRRQAATTRSDLYSLGVVLCRLLRCNLSSSLNEWRRHVSDPFFQEDLARCLADDPDERFPSASALAASLRSLPERRAAARTRERQARRKRIIHMAGVAAGLVALVALVAGLAWFSHYQYRQAWQNHSKFRLSEMVALRRSPDPKRGMQILDLAEKAGGSYPEEYVIPVRNEVLAALAMESPAGGGEVRVPGVLRPSIAIAAGGQWGVSWEGAVLQAFEIHDGGLQSRPPVTLPAPVAQCAITPDGSLCAAVTDDGSLFRIPEQGEALQIHDRCGLTGLAVHPSGKIGVPGVHGQVHLFTRTQEGWKLSHTVGTAPPVFDENISTELPPGPFTGAAELLAFSPDGAFIAVAEAASLHVKVWEAETGKSAGICLHTHIPTAVAWDPAPAGRLWTASADGAVYGWDITLNLRAGGAAPAVTRKPEPGAIPVHYIDAARDFPFIVCTDEKGGRIFLLKGDLSVDTASQEVAATACGFRGQDHRLWTLTTDASLYLNKAANRLVVKRMAGVAPVLRMSQSHDGSFIAASCGNIAAVSDAAALWPPVSLPATTEMMGIAFSAVAPTLYTTSSARGIRLWSWENAGRSEGVFTRQQPSSGLRYQGEEAGGGEVVSLQASDREWIILSGESSICAWPGAGEEIWSISLASPVTALVSGGSVPWFAASAYGEATALYFPASRTSRILSKSSREVVGLACSPDGRLVIERTVSGIRVIDLEREDRSLTFPAPLPPADPRTGRHRCFPVAVSMDKLVAVSSEQSRILLFRMETGNPAPVAELAMPLHSAPTALVFTQDGSLMAGTADGMLWLWRLPELRRELYRLSLDWEPPMTAGRPVTSVRPAYSKR